MATYKTPGTYVKEVPSLPASIAPVATAVPLFFGYTKLHDQNTALSGVATATKPVKVRSMREFVERFGGPNTVVTVEIGLDDAAIDAAILAGDNMNTLITGITLDAPSLYHILYYSLQLYFMNGGGPCYVISVGEFPDSGTLVDYETFEDCIPAAELIDEPTLLNIPEMAYVDEQPTTTSTNIDTRTANQTTVYKVLLAHCAKMQDRFAILDPLMAHSPDFFYPHLDDVTSDHAYPDMITGSTESFRSEMGTLNLSYGAAYYPYLKTILNVAFEPIDITFTQSSGAYLDGFTLQYVMDEASDGTTSPVEYARICTPSFLQAVYDGIAAYDNLILPPGAAVLGQIVQTDKSRGVWKAPANVGLNGVKALTTIFAPDELEDLNVPSDGQGKAINAIRQIPGRGIMIMGARTLDGNNLEWRYVPVRRLFIFVEESIRKAMDNLVFEPNDANTWNRVKTMISSFLDTLFRDGALLGTKPEQAYFVNVGLGTTMTPDDILNGQMIVEVGLAAVRPAEFIVLKFSHKLQES